jgi:hypothetical protein
MAPTIETAYPKLQLDLDEDLSPQIEAVLDACLADEALLGEDRTSERGQALEAVLRKAINAYASGALERVWQRSETEENEVLDRLTQKVDGLYDILLQLLEYPGLENRLENRIRSFRHHYEFKNKMSLPEFIGEQPKIFKGIREMIVDLQACVEAEINRKPKPEIIGGVEEGEKPIRLDTDEELEERMREWRQRSKDRKFPKDHALLKFLRVFKPYWDQYSPFEFSEGMYYRELGDTLSPLVAFLEEILSHVDGDITRQNIVGSVRKIREQSARKISS